MISLKGKVTLVTGASRGIGRATAVLFAEAGSDVVVHYRADEASAAAAAGEAARYGVRTRTFKAEMSNPGDVARLVDFTTEELGRIDVLVNNAGIWEEAAIDRMTEADLRRTIEVNLFGAFYATTAAVPHMKRQGTGNVIYVSSTAGQRGEANYSHYAASKGAIISLTKSLAPELAPHGIRVNCVAPGWVRTDMSRETLAGDGRDKVFAQIPLGRVGEPEEIAGCALFLASDLAGFVTGEILNVNGGAVLCG